MAVKRIVTRAFDEISSETRRENAYTFYTHTYLSHNLVYVKAESVCIYVHDVTYTQIIIEISLNYVVFLSPSSFGTVFNIFTAITG